MFHVRREKARAQRMRRGVLRMRERRGERTVQQWREVVIVRVMRVRRDTARSWIVRRLARLWRVGEIDGWGWGWGRTRRKVQGILKWSCRRWYMK